MQNVSEDNLCSVNYEMKNMVIRPNSEEAHSIYVELEIEPTVTAFERKQINLIEDLYSPTCNLEYTLKDITSLSEKQEHEKECTIKESIKVPNITEEGLIDVEIKPVILSTQVTNTKIMYSGEIKLNFIFMNENTVNTRVANIPFELSEDNPSGTDKIALETEMNVKKADFTVKNSGEVECKIDLGIGTKLSKNVSMNIIDNIEVANTEIADEDYNSLILYIVKPGDTLWNIAKQFNSTVEQIARMNGIENQDSIMPAQKLYIPKFQMVREDNNAREQAVSV